LRSIRFDSMPIWNTMPAVLKSSSETPFIGAPNAASAVPGRPGEDSLRCLELRYIPILTLGLA
jgi:hypothetical protein